jgi:hypothetical protein
MSNLTKLKEIPDPRRGHRVRIYLLWGNTTMVILI